MSAYKNNTRSSEIEEYYVRRIFENVEYFALSFQFRQKNEKKNIFNTLFYNFSY